MAPQHRPPQLKAPPGTCDTHMHIYDGRYPSALNATFTPPDAPVETYRQVRARLGLSRNVIVQPTTYSTDNRCTLDAIAALGPSARGVAVVDQTVTDAELDRLTQAGMRGIRFHMEPSGALPWDILETMAKRVLPFGWHVQLQMDGRALPERAALLERLPGVLVVDHVGKFHEPVPADHPGLLTLLRLLESGRTYVKLSAPYHSSKMGPPYRDIGALAKLLVQAAPERMLWATNWPHPTPGTKKPGDDAAMLDMLLDWIPDEATRHKVLVDNPARLYGFDR